PTRRTAEGLDAAADFHRVEAGHREGDGEVSRQLQWLPRPTPMSLARDVTTVGGATLASRLLGFARDGGIAAPPGGGGPSDAFFAVLQIANFFRRLLAEGALNAAFVPVWLRIKETQGESGAYAFFRQVLGAMLLAVGALAAMGLLFAPAITGLLAPGFDG